MKDYLKYTKIDLYIHLRANYMARYFGPRAELTCLWHVPRSDYRVLSYELFSLVQLLLLFNIINTFKYYYLLLLKLYLILTFLLHEGIDS